MSLGREINDFLGAFGKMDTIATNASKRRYYEGKIKGNDPNNFPTVKALGPPPAGYGGTPSFGRRLTNALGITTPNAGTAGSFVDPGGNSSYDDYMMETYAGGGAVGSPTEGGAQTWQRQYADWANQYNQPAPVQQMPADADAGEPPVPLPPVMGDAATPNGVEDRMPPMSDYQGAIDTGVRTSPMDYPGAAAARAPVQPGAAREAVPTGPARSPARGAAPAAPAQRKALNDQTRTEAYDPEQDGPLTPTAQGSAAAEAPAASPAGGGAGGGGYSPTAGGEGTTPNAAHDLEEAIRGGIRFAQKTFHLDNSNVAVGDDPHREGGTKALMGGVGAATPEMVQAMDRRVNQGVRGGPNAEQIYAIRRLEAIYRWKSMNGDKAGADKAAFELLQYSAGVASQLGVHAFQQARSGDTAGAVRTVQQAYNHIPDGRHMDVQGNTATITDTRTGKPVEQIQFTPEQVMNVALGLSNRSLYWQVLAGRVSQMPGTGTKRTESQQDLDRARADYYRARTANVGARGRGGGAAVAPAGNSIIERLDALPRPPGAPPTAEAPPRQPAAPSTTTVVHQGDDDGGSDDEDDGGVATNAPPDLKGPVEGAPPPKSILRLNPADRPSAGANPPLAPAVAGGGAPASGGGAGSRQPDDYQAWLKKNGLREDPDYDMNAAFKAGEQPDERGHMSDRFKKPSHPTFSDESVYNNEQNRGGHWEDLGGGKWAFTPGPANLKGGVERVREYLKRNDPDVELRMPSASNAASPEQDPDAVPDRELTLEGNKYSIVSPERAKPQSFSEPAPKGVPQELLDAQAQAAKLTAKQNGPAVRQYINARIKEWTDYNKAYNVRRKEFEQKELKRVDTEFKDAAAKRKSDAKGVYDQTLRPEARQKLATAIGDSLAQVIDTAKTKAGSEDAFNRSVYGDPTVDANRFKSMALDLMTTNPQPDPTTAVQMVGDLLRIDPEDPKVRAYRPVGKDVLGNVVVLSPTYGPVHIRPSTYNELTATVRKRLDALPKKAADAKAKAEADDNSPWKFGGKTDRATASLLRKGGSYVIGSGKEGSLAKDAATIAGKAITGLPTGAMRLGMKGAKALSNAARNYDPNDETRGPAFGP